ncbi:pyridoxal phosphate-dependent decarboxylase family protein [Aquihabitans daechungensis]|uniref:pyridoxal phosphate-dependent decarboxylase family protein n=1 Tax=Aquihabitans daechungensis TaxID=1052257 RepID=UPI003B9F276A
MTERGDPTTMHRLGPDGDDGAELIMSVLRRYLLESKDPRWGREFVPDVLGTVSGTVNFDGQGLAAALALVEDVIVPSCRPNDSPRMLSYVPTAPTLACREMDALLGALSIFGSHWEAGAGAIAAENEALRWLSDLAGLPAEAGGCFVSGGSAANLAALVTARFAWRSERGSGADEGPLRIAATAEAHASIAAVAHVMGVQLVDVRSIDGRMDVNHLRALLEADRRRPSTFAVVTTAGTTSQGLVDGLDPIADLCEEFGVWMHVDAAYGGAALCAPSVRSRFDGIERCDSLTIDPHKWLFAAYDCAAILYRDPQLAASAHAQRANYLDRIESEVWNPADYAFHLSRRAGGCRSGSASSCTAPAPTSGQSRPPWHGPAPSPTQSMRRRTSGSSSRPSSRSSCSSAKAGTPRISDGGAPRSPTRESP